MTVMIRAAKKLASRVNHIGLLGLLSLALAAPAMADEVTVRASATDERERLVFEWPAPVDYTAEIANGRLTISFARAIEADLSPAIAALAGVANAAAVSVDGRRVRFDLGQPRTLNAFATEDGRVVIDLIPPGAPAQQAATPAQAAPAASGAPNVPIRVGEHPEFGRIVFDWPRSVGYTVDRRRGDVVVNFDAPGRFDTATLAGRLPTMLEGLRVQPGGGDATIVIQAADETEVRHFRAGDRIVVDVLRGALPAPRPTTGDAPEALDAGEGAAAQAAPAEEAPPVARAGLAPQPEQPRTATGGARGAAPAEPPTPLPPLTDVTADATADATGPDGAQPAQTVAGALDDFDLGLLPPNTRAVRPGIGQEIPVQFVTGEDGAILAFSWPYPVPVAVFKRGDYLWVAFDETAEFDFSTVETRGGDLLGTPEIFEDARGSVMRFLLDPDLEPTVDRIGTTWAISLAPTSEPLRFSGRPEVQTSSSGQDRMFVEMRAMGATLELEDPTFADTLFITPTQSTRNGIAQTLTFDEFTLLPTAQGVATVQRSPNIFASTFEDGVAIRSPAGLTLRGDAVENAEAGGAAGGDAEQQLDRLFPLEAWRRGEPGEYQETRDDLIGAIAEAYQSAAGNALNELERQALNRRRLALAQFYFAHGFGEESLSVIDEITTATDGDPTYLNDRVFVAMRGAARVLARDVQGGLEDLSIPALDGEKEADLWRAAANVSLGRVALGRDLFFGTDAWVDEYPRHVRYFLNLLAAEAAIGMRDEQMIQLYLDFMFADDPTTEDLEIVTYLSGAASIAQGNIDEGVLVMESLLNAENPLARTRGTYDYVTRRLEQGPFDQVEVAARRQDAIERLERLQFEWRGDLFEVKVLRRLGELYAEENDFRRALNTMRRAVQLFPATREAAQIRQSMEDIFADLYLEDGADALPPLTALALFDEFRELVPVGEDGDEMIRKLADRLVEVDLLDRAAGLLEHQVEFRLASAEKSRVGARLAVVRLLDREPELAVNALDASVTDDMPLTLIDQRRRLRAQALYQSDEVDEALLLLTGDDSPEARLLRAEIAWRNGLWGEAGRFYEDVLGFPDPIEPLTPEQAALVMNITVAYTLDEDEVAVTRLREDFGQRMAETEHARAFDLVTTQPEQGLGIMGELAEVQTFQAFLGDLRQQVGDEGLSAIN